MGVVARHGRSAEVFEDRPAARVEPLAFDSENVCDFGCWYAVDEHRKDRNVVGIEPAGRRPQCRRRYGRDSGAAAGELRIARQNSSPSLLLHVMPSAPATIAPIVIGGSAYAE
jgi:hypothetical protein